MTIFCWKSSPTFLDWISAELSETNKAQLWIPRGFAHGFLSLKEGSEVLYKATSYWSKSDERSILWNDERLCIKWPIEDFKDAQIIISEKDNMALKINQINDSNFFE